MYDDLATTVTTYAGDPIEGDTHASEHAPDDADSVFGAAKTTPVAADPIVIKDSEASDAVKTATSTQVVALGAAAIAAKATPVTADLLVIQDSAASNAPKSATIAQVADLMVGAAKATPVLADKIVIQDTEASDAVKTVSGTVLNSLLQSGQEIAEDGECEIKSTDACIYLTSSTTGTKTITVASSRPFQPLKFVLAARAGGQYDLAVSGGTLTMDAAAEAPLLMRNAADDAWLVIELNGATVA
jgi:hypothetical protein